MTWKSNRESSKGRAKDLRVKRQLLAKPFTLAGTQRGHADCHLCQSLPGTGESAFAQTWPSHDEPATSADQAVEKDVLAAIRKSL